MLANLKPGDGGRYRAELATNLRRGIHLQIEGILMRRPARQVHHDHSLVVGPEPSSCLGLQQLRQAQSSQSQSANAEKTPSGDSVTKTVRGSGKGQHG